MAWTTPKDWVPGEIVTAQDLDTHLKDNLLAVVPVGVVLPYGGATPPNSLYLLCNGAAVSRTTYAALFAILGTAFGAGDGSTTFNLPDMRGRVLVGKGTNTSVDVMGENEGVAEPSRRPHHGHTLRHYQFSGAAGNVAVQPTVNSSAATSTSTGAIGPGGTVPLDAPAYLVLNYIIKALE